MRLFNLFSQPRTTHSSFIQIYPHNEAGEEGEKESLIKRIPDYPRVLSHNIYIVGNWMIDFDIVLFLMKGTYK